MKKRTRLGHLLKESRAKITRRKSSSNTKENYTLNARSAGLKQVRLESQSSTLLYDDVHTCPLSIYIEVTCDDSKLNLLTIEGNPSEAELEEARYKLMSDFSELSNSGESQAVAETICNFFYQRNIVLGYELALNLVAAGRFDKAIDYLCQNGMQCDIPSTEEEFQHLVKKIGMRLKNRLAKYKIAKSQYKDITSKKGDKPTRRYYNKLLIMLSTCDAVKIQLNPKQMTVAEFAEYLNLFNEYQNHLKMKNVNHGS